MTDFNKSLGPALREIREEHKKTQQEIADMLGVTKVSVHQWEAGKRNMYAKTLKKYCDALGIKMQTVFDRIEENKK